MERERRAEPRHPVFRPTEVALIGERPAIGVTSNLSPSGALIMTHRAFSVGDDLIFTLLLGDERRVSLMGRVVHQRQLEEELLWRYETAVELSEPALAGGFPSVSAGG